MKERFIYRAGKRICITIVLCMIAGEVFSAVVEKSFDEYDIILERKPFGEYVPPPKAVDSKEDKAAAEAKAQFEKYIIMCAITDSTRGVRVGLRDTQQKPARSYFLYVGDVDGNIELLDADYQQGWASFSVGGEKMERYLDKTVAPSTAPDNPTRQSRTSSRRSISVPRAPSIPTRESKTPTAAPKINLPENVQKRLSYAERRKMKLDEEAQKAQKAKMLEEMARKYKESKGKLDISAEERRTRMQKDMMELIRAGKTTDKMPIVLTPEMEAQLVKEGVLPPSE